MEGESEWESHWKLDGRDFVAFIRQGTCTVLPLEDFDSNSIARQLNDDVWVFNGLIAKQTKGRDALDAVRWSQLGREFVLRVHIGASVVADDAWRADQCEGSRNNLDYLLAKARSYSGSSHDLFGSITAFASAKEAKGEEYSLALRRLRETLGLKVSRMQSAIDLLTMFLQFDIQLQLQEEDIAACKKEAIKLESEAPRMADLLGRVVRQNVSPEQIQPAETPITRADAITLLQNLMICVRQAREAATRSEMHEVFGFRTEHGSEGEDGAPILNDHGFHRTYERMRNVLLTLVESD